MRTSEDIYRAVYNQYCASSEQKHIAQDGHLLDDDGDTYWIGKNSEVPAYIWNSDFAAVLTQLRHGDRNYTIIPLD